MCWAGAAVAQKANVFSGLSNLLYSSLDMTAIRKMCLYDKESNTIIHIKGKTYFLKKG